MRYRIEIERLVVPASGLDPSRLHGLGAQILSEMQGLLSAEPLPAGLASATMEHVEGAPLTAAESASPEALAAAAARRVVDVLRNTAPTTAKGTGHDQR